MQFFNSSNDTGLVQDITFLTGLDTNAVSIAHRARLVNRWYHKAAILAWKSDPDWQFDDVNIGTGQADNNWTYDATFVGLPRAKRDLTDDVKMYRLPTNALAIERVEVLRTNGDWIVLSAIEESKLMEGFTVPEFLAAVPEFLKTKGLPRFYNLVGANIEIFPPPDSSQVTVTAGIQIYVTREVDEFVKGDTIQEPGIPEPYHRILSLGASYDIALAKGLEQASTLKQEVEQLLFEMEGYYVDRHRHNKKSIKPGRKSYI